MSHHPLRRRDRGARLDEDYIAAGDSPYYENDHSRRRDDSPPRRDRTRRARRPASPELYAPQPRYESPPPTRSRSTRDPPPRYGADSPPRRRRSPPPAYASDSSRRNRGGPPPRGDLYDRDSYGSGSYATRGRYDEPDSRARRTRTYSVSPERRTRGGRDRPPPAFDDASAPRRHRSSAGRTGGYDGRGTSPPPMRNSRPPPATAGRPQGRGRGPQARRNSMPAATGADGAEKKAGWWTNPIIQASARTALTAGAQAAMNSRKDKGPWIGPKGAKVASAALMGGFMDGFMGQKSSGGGSGGGGDRGAAPEHSSMKSDLMRQGMMAALGHFGSRR